MYPEKQLEGLYLKSDNPKNRSSWLGRSCAILDLFTSLYLLPSLDRCALLDLFPILDLLAVIGLFVRLSRFPILGVFVIFDLFAILFLFAILDPFARLHFFAILHLIAILDLFPILDLCGCEEKFLGHGRAFRKFTSSKNYPKNSWKEAVTTRTTQRVLGAAIP